MNFDFNKLNYEIFHVIFAFCGLMTLVNIWRCLFYLLYDDSLRQLFVVVPTSYVVIQYNTSLDYGVALICRYQQLIG